MAPAPFKSQANPAPAAPDPVTERKFAQFDDWARRYLRAAPGDRESLAAEGLLLAERRRDEMMDLIQADPARALELAVASGVRRQLPPAIAALLEERISAYGTLEVFAIIPEPGREGEIPPVYRRAQIQGTTYQAFVYGRRSSQPTLQNAALQGVALDDLLALHEDPVRVLNAEEAAMYAAAAAPVTTCAWDGGALEGNEVVWAQSGGVLLCLCSAVDAALLNQEAIEGELSAANWLAAASSPAESRRVLLIRVDFPDLEGEPLSESAAVNLIRNVDAFYQEMSYGQAGFALSGEGSDVTPVFRMPQTAAYYGELDPSRLRLQARQAAREAGYDFDGYDLDITCFGAVPGFRFAGLAYVGGRGAWLRNSFSIGVAAHELGHNLGLNHANFWDTSGQSVIGTGTSVEYGDSFDTMGSANAGPKHFNARYKNLLDWLPASDVITVTRSGAYQITAFDDPSALGSRALKIARDTRTNYWVEFRQKYVSNKWLMDGAGLRWAGNANESSRLLDTTPGSAAGKDDSALLIGRTFSDRAAGIHITPLRKVGTSPESLEVYVGMGSFSANRVPSVVVAGDTNSSQAGVELAFTATAVDPDGDALAYSWDFGDQEYGPNQASVRHRWVSTGEYVVRCEVSDMKGGRASDSLVVRVGSPSTFRLSGQVAVNGVPLEGVRIYVSSSRSTHTGSDGRYNLVGLGSGSYNVRAVLEGFTLLPAGFLNPLQVGPSKVNVDFLAINQGEGNTRALVPAGSLWQFSDDGSQPDSSWRELDFDDGHWSEGPAPLGYGDDNEKTLVSYGPSASRKYITTYFRHRFDVNQPGAYSSLTLGLRRDDGGVVYLNGREVFRSNMPVGNITGATLASSAVGGSDERAFFAVELDPALLKAGTNVLAVEIHQSSRSSSDLAFDLELMGLEVPTLSPPALSWSSTHASLTLSWPEGPTDWLLYSGPDIGAAKAWVPTAVPIESTGGQRVARISFTRPQQYYRLAAPQP